MTLMLICPSAESTRRMEEMLRSVSGGKVNIVSYSSAPELRLIGFDCDAVIALGMNAKRAGQTFAACSPLDSGFLYIAGENVPRRSWSLCARSAFTLCTRLSARRLSGTISAYAPACRSVSPR